MSSNLRPAVFIGSSSEGLAVAKALDDGLRSLELRPRLWTGEFSAGQFYLQVLRRLVEEVDFAVLVCTPDDVVHSRGQEKPSPRDNVLFELGLFMGGLGPQRAFLLHEQRTPLKIPSDLDGLVFVSYRDSPVEGLPAALTEACHSIKKAIGQAPSRMQPTVPLMAFESLISEYEEVIDSLENDEWALVREIHEDGDFERLLRGLRDGILFIAPAAVTGYVDPVFYGNLMEYDAGQRELAHTHSFGPYSTEVITRRWPLKRRKGQGVAAKAFLSGEIQVRNEMEGEGKTTGEERLKALLSVPVETEASCRHEAIAVLNIDAARAHMFPEPPTKGFAEMKNRLDRVVELLRRTNRLRDAIR